ncbi:major allergen I polypeptide chain 2-like [Moschus berezovskii]|uniref:major allergen I polypeptide chain 2-like n=1 Tax=Moschus berezovskii TaxID=68408 RepID=UPI002444FCE0|nr:major allergen I polypeptide chain 2-like [Moschus berezovskii]
MMKGALLVLAFLVTRELNFKTSEAEACPVFYEGISGVILGLPSKALNETLDLIDANEAEKEAIGKIRDCFTEAGPENRFNNLKFKVSIIFSKDCNGYKLSSVVNAVIGLVSSLLSLV